MTYSGITATETHLLKINLPVNKGIGCYSRGAGERNAESASVKLMSAVREKLGHRWWQLVPLQGVGKVVITLVGILPTLFYPSGVNRLMMVDWEDPQWAFVFKDSQQHITMCGFFMLSGVVDFVSQSCQVWQNMKLEQAAEALGSYVLALLMAAHIENKDTLEIHVYELFSVPTFLVSLVLTFKV
ncbi:hypothetical protein H8959_020437 [Pygathrix nigripes]